MRVAIIVSCIFLLALTGCGSSRGGPAGDGVDVSIVNIHELRDVYFPYYPGQDRPTPDDVASRLSADGDYVEIMRMTTLLHNSGYSDSLAALYITGYDPNLFAVIPLGPYAYHEGARYCYTDLTLQTDFDYSVYQLCAAANDVFIGGGITGEGGSITGGRVDVYNVNVGKFFDNFLSAIKNEPVEFFQDRRLFEGMDLHCEATQNTGDIQTGVTFGGARVGTAQRNCFLSFGFANLYIDRSSRGTLLLALHGPSVRDCANGCVLAPPGLLPDNYLAGDQEDYPGGQALYADFSVLLDRGRWPANLNDHQQLFQVTACYLYTTYLTPTVCIDPTPATSDGEVCQAGVLSLGEAQGAPVKITRIDQVNQGPRVMFTIHVENTRGGTSFHPGAIDFCAPSSPETYSRELRDVAKIIDARVLGSLKALDCRDGMIRMQNGQGRITCFYELDALSNYNAFQTTLNIEIGYLYRDIQTVQANIHRI